MHLTCTDSVFGTRNPQSAPRAISPEVTIPAHQHGHAYANHKANSSCRAAGDSANINYWHQGSIRGAAVEDKTVTIQVPATDRKDLEALARDLDYGPDEILGSQAFDGATLLTLLVSVSAGTATVLRTWLTTRAAMRKSLKLILNGKHFEGYTKDQVLAMIAAIESLEKSS
jgi:hypothetical protein